MEIVALFEKHTRFLVGIFLIIFGLLALVRASINIENTPVHIRGWAARLVGLIFTAIGIYLLITK